MENVHSHLFIIITELTVTGILQKNQSVIHKHHVAIL